MSSQGEDDFCYLQIRARETGLAFGRSVFINMLGQPSVLNWKFEAHCHRGGDDLVLMSAGFQLYVNTDPADAGSEQAAAALAALHGLIISDGWEPIERFPWESAGMAAGPWYGRRYQMTAERFRAIAGAESRNGRQGPASRRGLAWVLAGAGLVAASIAAIVAFAGSGGRAAPQDATGAEASAPAATSPAAGSVGSPGSLPSGQPSSAGPEGAGGSTPPGNPGSQPPAGSHSAPGPRPSPPVAVVPPGAAGLAAPAGVAATALGQHQIRVSWTESSPGATGFRVDNGCSATTCEPGAALAATTGPVTSAIFAVTPGTYQCFRAQALSGGAASGWSGFGCTTTPSLTVAGTQQWTATGVLVTSGDDLGITAAGLVYVDPSYPQGPAGNPSCTPAVNYAAASFDLSRARPAVLVARRADRHRAAI